MNTNLIEMTGKPEIEVVKLTADDFSLKPQRLSIPMNFCYIWGHSDDPKHPPIHFQRAFDGKVGIHGGDIQMGETPQAKNIILDHSKDIYPTGHPLSYIEIKGDPEGKTNDLVTYEASSKNPDVLIRFSSKSIHFVESNYIDVTFDYLPYAFIMNGLGTFGSPYMIQMSTISGTYGGKKMTFLGGSDRMFGSNGAEFIKEKKVFIDHLFFSGIHHNGIREWGYVFINEYKRGGFYCKDGEEPIVTTNVKYYPQWETLSYADDGAQLLTKATYSFGGKEINYEAKYGWRGHGEKYINGGPCGMPGFSQGSGIWYEGSKPYEFERIITYHESYNAIPGKILPE